MHDQAIKWSPALRGRGERSGRGGGGAEGREERMKEKTGKGEDEEDRRGAVSLNKVGVCS